MSNLSPVDLNEATSDSGVLMQWHQLDHLQTICTSLQTDNHTNTSSLKFYRPGALPDAQPTVLTLKAIIIIILIIDLIFVIHQDHTLPRLKK